MKVMKDIKNSEKTFAITAKGLFHYLIESSDYVLLDVMPVEDGSDFIIEQVISSEDIFRNNERNLIGISLDYLSKNSIELDLVKWLRKANLQKDSIKDHYILDSSGKRVDFNVQFVGQINGKISILFSKNHARKRNVDNKLRSNQRCDLIIRTTSNFEITYLSKEGNEFFGLDQSKMTGSCLENFISWEDFSDLQNLIANKNSNNLIHFDELRFISSSGDIIYGNTNIHEIKNNSGMVEYVFIVQIPAKTRPEQTNSYQKNRAIEQAVFGVVMVDSNFKISYANQAFFDFWGFETEQQIIGKNIVNILTSPYEVIQVAKKLVKLGTYSGELEAKKRNGEKFFIQFSANLTDAPDGSNSGAVATVIDITEQKKNELELKRKADEFAGLYQSSIEINKILEPQQLVDRLYGQVENLFHPDSFLIAQYYPELEEIEIGAAYEKGVAVSELTNYRAKLTESGLTGYVVTTGKSLNIQDLHTDPVPPVENLEFGETVRAWMGVPLRVHETVIGAISIQSFVPNAFDHEHLRILEMLANQVAISLENARLYQNAIKASESRKILYRASQEITNAAQDPEAVYKAVHHVVSQILSCDAIVITLRDEEKGNIRNVYEYDHGQRWQAPIDPIKAGLCNKLFINNEPFIIHDLIKDDYFSKIYHDSLSRVRSVLAVPIKHGYTTIGVLSVQSYTPNAYNEDDLQLLELVASHTGDAIEIARLFVAERRRMQELALVARVSAALRGAEQRDEMVPILLHELEKLFLVQGAALILFNSVKGDMLVDQATGYWKKYSGEIVSEKEPLFQLVKNEKLPFVEFKDRNDADLFIPGWLPGFALIPLFVRGQTIGALCLGREEQFADQDVHLLTSIGDITANAINRLMLHEQTNLQVERLSTLHNIDLALSANVDLKVTIDAFIRQIIKQLEVDAVAINIFDPKTQTLCYFSGIGFYSDEIKKTKVRLNEGIAGVSASEKRMILVKNLQSSSSQFSRNFLLDKEEFHSYLAVPLISKGNIKGVMDIFLRETKDPSPDWFEYLETLATQAAIAIDNADLFNNLQKSNLELALAYDRTLEGWSRALELRDQETQGHTKRVADIAVKLAKSIGVSDQEITHLHRGALLHDIGKIAIPDSILLKPGKLTEEEWVIMREHPIHARKLLEPIDFLGNAIDIPYFHHEKWDGTGYPLGLKGEEIPLSARIFTVVDVWDALTSKRSYRDAWDEDKTMEYIKEQSGSHFDPKIVVAFVKMMNRNKITKEN